MNNNIIELNCGPHSCAIYSVCPCGKDCIASSSNGPIYQKINKEWVLITNEKNKCPNQNELYHLGEQ